MTAALEQWQSLLGVSAWDGRIANIGDPVSEVSLLDQGPVKTPQPGLGVVEVSGDEATDFLHAQLAADCRLLKAGESVLSAWCSPKGRVLFLLRIIRTPSAFLVLLAHDQIAAFIKRLTMFVFRAQVVLTDLSDSHAVILCNGGISSGEDADVVRGRDRTQAWLIVKFADLHKCWAALDACPVGEATATLNDIRLGIAHLPSALVDEFLPQELNLDITAGVSFEKGCYPGQEIIARVKFRGTVKRRLARLLGTGAVPAPLGMRLLGDNDQALGTVLMAEYAGAAEFEMLAVLKRDADDVFSADLPARRLQRAAMIYDVAD